MLRNGEHNNLIDNREYWVSDGKKTAELNQINADRFQRLLLVQTKMLILMHFSQDGTRWPATLTTCLVEAVRFVDSPLPSGPISDLPSETLTAIN